VSYTLGAGVQDIKGHLLYLIPRIWNCGGVRKFAGIG